MVMYSLLISLMIMKIENAAILLGKKGGEKTKEIYGVEHFFEIQKKSVKSRKHNKRLRLAEISCGQK